MLLVIRISSDVQLSLVPSMGKCFQVAIEPVQTERETATAAHQSRQVVSQLGNLRLGSHGVNGDDAAADIQEAQQLRNCCDFIGFLIDLLLSEHLMIGCGPGTDHMDSLFVVGLVV